MWRDFYPDGSAPDGYDPEFDLDDEDGDWVCDRCRMGDVCVCEDSAEPRPVITYDDLPF